MNIIDIPAWAIFVVCATIWWLCYYVNTLRYIPDMLDFLRVFTMLVMILGITFSIIKGIADSKGFQEWDSRHKKEIAEREYNDAQVRVVREFDNCKVYAFKSTGHWHYVTKCGKAVTTETNWTERHGKRSVNKQEVVVTKEEE